MLVREEEGLMTSQNELSFPTVITAAEVSLGGLRMKDESSLWLGTAYVILGQVAG